MEYYVVQNKKNGKLVSGTDRRYNPQRQIYADEFRPPMLFSQDKRIYEIELKIRGINMKNFRLLEIKIEQ